MRKEQRGENFQDRKHKKIVFPASPKLCKFHEERNLVCAFFGD